jgi:hypothetical protein
VNCLPGDAIIPFADGVEVAYRRWYSGKLTEIVMASGKTLRATPNHPVLTPHGWVKIDALKEGDYVIETAGKIIRPVTAEANEHHTQMTISEIFGAVSERGVPQVLAGQSQQFHGDGSKADVDVVYAVRPLRLSYPSPTGAGSHFQALLFEPGVDRPSIDPKTPSQRQNAFPFPVKAGKVIKVNRIGFSGHVYNLQTVSGQYISQGVVTHNCRCWLEYIASPRRLPDQFLTRRGQEFIAAGGQRSAA